MKKREISFEERKTIQLEMLKEIDAFCRNNKIRYSLAFGTLLGAIRHKGFIPWDDDVDIMMPLPDMLLFKKLFKSETMKYCDVDTEKHFEFGFSRIVNTKTYNKRSIFNRTYGINIDLYPIVPVPEKEKDRNVFFQNADKINIKRLNYIKWRNRFLHYTPLRTLPGFDTSITKLRDYFFCSYQYGETNMYYIIAGPFALREKMTYPFDLFSEIIDVEFEGGKFMAISKYHSFLEMRYGDYMQLPPKEERHPYHGGHYYWK